MDAIRSSIEGCSLPTYKSQRFDILSLFFSHVAIHSRSYKYVHQVETIARYSLL